MKPKPYTPPFPLFTDGEVTPGCEWAIKKHDDVYNYLDGIPALVHKGTIYKVGEGSAWAECGAEDGVYREALHNFRIVQGEMPESGLYQVIGYSVHDNPYGLTGNTLAWVMNDQLRVKVSDRSYEGMWAHFEQSPAFGVLFTYTRGRMALVKRTDFGLKWPPFEVFL